MDFKIYCSSLSLLKLENKIKTKVSGYGFKWENEVILRKKMPNPFFTGHPV